MPFGLIALVACTPPSRAFPDGEGGDASTGSMTGVGGQTTTSNGVGGNTTSSGGGGTSSSSGVGGSGGGTTSSSGVGGSGGGTTSSSSGMVECFQDSDCGVGSECKQVYCSAGMCVITNVGSGTPLAAQSFGDCKLAVCDGQGGTTTIPDNNDAPGQAPHDCTINVCDGQGNVIAQPDANDPPTDEGNPCTGESCNGTTPIHPSHVAGTDCGGGANVCNGFGKCINHCNDGVANYDEDDVDCGGSACTPCLGDGSCAGDICAGTTICCFCNGSFSCMLPKPCNLCSSQQP